MSFLRKKNLNMLLLFGLSLLINGIQAKETGKTLEELLAELQSEAPIATSVENKATVVEPTKQASSKTLEQLLAELQKEAPIKVARSAAAASKEEEEGDRYVQSEAHLQLDDVQFRMADFLQRAIGAVPKKGEILSKPKRPNEMVTPYLNIVATALKKEVELKKTHYVFYHGATTNWRVVYDFYKQIYAYYNPLQSLKDFMFLRFTDMPTKKKAQDFLADLTSQYGGVNDNNIEVRTNFLAVNLAMFGNVGVPGECTWNYFLEPKSHLMPDADKIIQPILEKFKLSYDVNVLVKEIAQLTELLGKVSEEQAMIQIFIPQDKVDDVAYLAWILGFPAHEKSMKLIKSMFESRPKVGAFTGQAVKEVMDMYATEGIDNPLYKDLLEAVKNGDFKIAAYLKEYRNNPSKLVNPNAKQARLLLSNDVLLNPKSGVKFFVYFTTPKEVQDKYLKMLNELVKKIIRINEERAANEAKAANKEKENEQSAHEES